MISITIPTGNAPIILASSPPIPYLVAGLAGPAGGDVELQANRVMDHLADSRRSGYQVGKGVPPLVKEQR